MNEKSRQESCKCDEGKTQDPPRLCTAELFRGGNRIEIEHRGETYRLQITRQGKLILTK